MWDLIVSVPDHCLFFTLRGSPIDMITFDSFDFFWISIHNLWSFSVQYSGVCSVISFSNKSRTMASNFFSFGFNESIYSCHTFNVYLVSFSTFIFMVGQHTGVYEFEVRCAD